MLRRLGIVVPLRDRESHLTEFLATVPAFVAQDARSAGVEARVLVVEQAAGKPFNRGLLLNIGVNLLGDSVDYLCLHDVDTLPVDADYGWPERPTMIVLHGLKYGADFARKLFGTVVLVQRSQFAAANGFSNGYWGWGFEDVDFRERLLRGGLRVDHREGTFRSLPHLDLGSNPDGTPTEIFRSNQAIYIDQWFAATPGGWRRKLNPSDRWRRDGLNSLQFDVLRSRAPLAGAPSGAVVESVAVDFAGP